MVAQQTLERPIPMPIGFFPVMTLAGASASVVPSTPVHVHVKFLRALGSQSGVSVCVWQYTLVGSSGKVFKAAVAAV